MQVLKFKTADDLDLAGAQFVINKLKGDQSRLLCAATGSSATGVYQIVAKRKSELNAATLKIIKLDEWAGLAMDHPGSCEHYLQQYLLKPLNIQAGNYISFNSKATEPAAECERIAAKLKLNGPIDLCILGLGLNGHIAFNDPADELQPGVHLSKLSPESMAHPMVQDVAERPQYGYTLGMADILQSKTILLVVKGQHKKQIFEKLMEARVNTHLPASFLWLHNNAHCYYCEN